MRLWFRPLEHADLPGCLEIMYNRAIYSEEALVRLPQCWKRLMEMDAAITAAVLDRDRPPKLQLAGFGLSVIITEEFANRIRQQLSPDSAMTILNALDGDNPPVLTRRSLGRENAQNGLHLLVHYFGFRKQEGPALYYLNKKMIDSFNFMHFGYRWKEILALVYGDMVKEGYLAGGYRIRAETGEFYRDTPECLPAPPLRPFLLGLLREEIEGAGDFGSRLAPVFVYQRPCFQFRRGEQELLLRVLLGETDEEVAAALCISMHTVKTRWRNIYTRVESSRPDFFPNTTTPGRGPARRSLLLRYLEDHLEELRPFSPPSGIGV